MRKEVTNSQVLMSEQVISKLMYTSVSPILGLKLSKFKKAYVDEVEPLKKLRAELFKKYWGVDEKGKVNMPDDKSEKYPEFEKEAKEIFDAKTSIENFDITFKMLSKLEFSVMEYEVLEWFFTNDLE